MNLNEILQKTKTKSEKVTRVRKPPSIALEERPYGINEHVTILNSEEKVESFIPQNEDNIETNLIQTEDDIQSLKTKKINILSESKDRIKDTNRDNISTNQRQKISKKVQSISPLDTFSSLVGLQRKITLFLYEECKLNRSKFTRPLTVEHISQYCSSTIPSVKKSLQRLEKKGIIIRAEYKLGRGGWTKYEVPEHIYNEIIYTENHFSIDPKREQYRDKLEFKPETKLETNTSNSNSNLNNITTIKIGLSNEWAEIDISPLKEIGFTQTHLLQIEKDGKLNSTMVQDSINAYSFDLFNNNKLVSLKNRNILPLNYFMKVLRNGGPYAPPDNYEDPKDKALRIYLEKKGELEKNRAEREKELIMMDFNDWLLSLSEEEKKSLLHSILPRILLNSDAENIKTAHLRMYHADKIWPLNREKILKNLD